MNHFLGPAATLAAALVLCTSCATKVPTPSEILRFRDSPASQSIISFLIRGDAIGVTRQFEYPPHYRGTRLAEDQEGVARAIRFFLLEFGRLRAVTPASEGAEFY